MNRKDGVKLIWDKKNQANYTVASPKLKKIATVHPYIPPTDLISLNALLKQGNESINGRLIQGHNLEVMQSLLGTGYKEKFDLIYLDPPFFSKSNYTSTIKLPGNEEEVITREVFADNWQALSDYLDYIWHVLQNAYKLLGCQGSLFVHVDWHASHYIKILLDEIFTPAGFINEIIWCYGGGGNARRHFHRKHDTIFWYAKGKDYIFNPIYRPYTEKTKARGLTKVKGPKYQLNKKGALMQDWWTDINKILSPTAYENLKFPTQKPFALLSRIIRAASHEGSLVGDFFAGSGTTLAVAEELKRKWVACDASNIAIQTTHNRLININAQPFKIEAVKPPQEKPLFVKLDKTQYPHKLTISLQGAKLQGIYFWEVGLKHGGQVLSLMQITRPHFQAREIKKQITLENVGNINVEQLVVKAYDYGGQVYTCTDFDLAR